MKNKFATILIIVATLLLAGVAIFTAIRLYQSRTAPVAPNVPSSRPAAAVPSCTLTFSLTQAAATATATGSSRATATATPTGNATATATSTSVATATATATSTATANPQCNTTCSSNDNCPSQYVCYKASGATTGNCRNTQCVTESDCTCAVATATPTATSRATATSTATGTSQPELPDAGTSWPTLVGTVFGVIVILGSILLAL